MKGMTKHQNRSCLETHRMYRQYLVPYCAMDYCQRICSYNHLKLAERMLAVQAHGSISQLSIGFREKVSSCKQSSSIVAILWELSSLEGSQLLTLLSYFLQGILSAFSVKDKIEFDSLSLLVVSYTMCLRELTLHGRENKLHIGRL